ncbi:MAG: glycosyl transferase family 2 [Lysobacterales bacterium RIFOXYD1_FULL_69_11]|nr:MAG: glycosyl transferase family 2 [Xanthomonadales bacterium RIFOXYA1_FULL_69_10]OHE88553.1 MAG: glycosyl transferase family 2 [Xanthomonadales bacterium RIFOXYD1_FULL_69_11]
MLSLIVPAHDEATRLPATLQALHAAASATVGTDGFEIVVVDDASSDGTGDIARAAGARVLRVEHRHIAATRNAGARAARGDTLVFVDADTRVDTALLRAALSALEAGAVGGGATVALRGPLAWHVRAGLAASNWLLRRMRAAAGCFVFCRRDAFEAVGGFDERWFAGEDVALSRALATQGRFVVLRERVSTSARKLRSHPLREHLWLLLRFAVRGRRLLRSRDALGLWYGGRRD